MGARSRYVEGVHGEGLRGIRLLDVIKGSKKFSFMGIGNSTRGEGQIVQGTGAEREYEYSRHVGGEGVAWP